MCPDLGSSRGSPTAAPDLSHVCPASGRLPAPRRLAGLRVPGLRQCSRGRPGGGAGPPTCTAVSHRAANGPADARPAWPSGIATGPGRWPCLTQPRPQAAAPLAGNRKRGRWKADAVMNSRTIPRTTVRTPSQQWRIWISADRCQEGSLRRQVGETRWRAST
jgi:hypothetical protein